MTIQDALVIFWADRAGLLDHSNPAMNDIVEAAVKALAGEAVRISTPVFIVSPPATDTAPAAMPAQDQAVPG